MTASPVFLRETWPLFLLSRHGEAACSGRPLLDLLCPATPDDLRATYGPVLAQTNPTAAAGLEATDDDELACWVNVLRGPLLTGRLDELTFMPAWLTVDGVLLDRLARLLTLSLHERQDAFLAAMHRRGSA